jgi:hypothetical protein
MAIDWRGFHVELLDVAGVLWFFALRLFALRLGYAQCAERRAKTGRAWCRR